MEFFVKIDREGGKNHFFLLPYATEGGATLPKTIDFLPHPHCFLPFLPLEALNQLVNVPLVPPLHELLGLGQWCTPYSKFLVT